MLDAVQRGQCHGVSCKMVYRQIAQQGAHVAVATAVDVLHVGVLVDASSLFRATWCTVDGAARSRDSASAAPAGRV